MPFDRRVRRTLFASVSFSALLVASNALTNPLGPDVVIGDVTIDGLGTDHVIVDNNSNRAVVNWDEFSIGVGETTTINQITNDAAILNRVTGSNVTEIYGTLESNGQVFLINENGILVGANGVVETNGFVGSTLDVTNADFLNAGEMLFSQGIEAGGGIEIYGKIRSVSGGDIFLLSREITIHEGAEVDAKGGYVGLGAGEEILLKPVDSGNGRISIRAGKGKIVNRGTVAGVAAELKAAGGNEYALAINNTGVVRATGVSRSGGRIRLGAGGKIRNSGRLTARKKVIVRSTEKIINSGTVQAGDGQNGGEVIFDAPEITIEAGSLIDVSAALGGGRVFIGGGFQGTNADRNREIVDIEQNSQNTIIEFGAVIAADATESGNGGDIVIWSDGHTGFGGEVSATAANGDGGFVEVSGAGTLIFAGNVDTSAADGTNGTLLLDPTDIDVIDGLAGTGINDGELGDNSILSGDGGAVNFTITDGTLEAQLANNSVTIQATNDINFAAGVQINWTNQGGGSNDNSLFTVDAGNDINALDDVIIQNAGSGTGIDTDEGGVVFIAGNDINIGSSGSRTGRVTIGSEYGQNTFTAANEINVIGGGDNGAGGNASFGSAHIGFEMGSSRGGGSDARNGTITLTAGGDINITSVLSNPTSIDGVRNFARVGHGGFRGPTASAVAEIDGDIFVESTGGSIVIDGAATSHGQRVPHHATIGHGSDVVAGGFPITQGRISGDISVSAAADILINTNITASQFEAETSLLGRIGHGGTVAYGSASNLLGDDAEYTSGEIQGRIDVTAIGEVVVGSVVTLGVSDENLDVFSHIGHGAFANVSYADPGDSVDDEGLDIVHGSIIGFDRLGDRNAMSTDINVSAGAVSVISGTVNDTGIDNNFMVDAISRSQIGHSPISYMLSPFTPSEDSPAITVTENRITGDITIIDTDFTDGQGVLVSSTITAGGAAPTTGDYATSRIGHAGGQFIEGMDGIVDPVTGIAGNGADITVFQAHILSADITIDTLTGGNMNPADDALSTDDQDISLVTSVTASNNPAEDNTTVAQIGHGSDTLVQSGNGASQNGLLNPDGNAGDGGDITIVRGTVWDGSLIADNDADDDDDLHIINTTDINILASNQLIIDSDTASALASTDRSNAESQLGHGFRIRLETGNGGTSIGEGAAGGAGGDVLVYQGVDVREYGIDNDRYDDYAYGLRGDITVSAVDLVENAIDITSDDSSSMAPTNFNSDYSTLGHGDVIEITTGHGGDGSSGRDFEGDDNDIPGAGPELDPTGQVAVYGGRGGHIDVQLGRYDHVGDSTANPVLGSLFFDERAAGLNMFNPENLADIGDSRAMTLGGVSRIERQGVSLTEGDIRITSVGTINVAGSINNALTPSNYAISESVIGHAHRIFGDSGNGGNAGSGNFHSQDETVFQTEIFGEQFLNYDSGYGSNRGGNGGDIRITHGDITDRTILHRIGDDHAEITHDTDADHGGTQASEFVDGSSDIFITILDENAEGTVALGDSLIVASTINAGLGENNGDVYSLVGHHVRLFGEAGFGGDGGTTNTEFDENGESLFTDGTGQTDTQTGTNTITFTDGADGYDETAEQAGAVFIQPNGSGGRGGDALIINNNISGDIVVDAARRVTISSGDGHGGYSKVFASIGHTTDLVAVTQFGGAGADLDEDSGFDGGIINVGGGQNGDNGSNEAGGDFDHVLIDGNQDDDFNLENNDNSQEITGEDGIAVTPDDIADRTGSTFASVNDHFGTLQGTGVPNGDGAEIFDVVDGDEVIFHDEEADPNFILDDVGNFVANNEANNQLYAENAQNLGRFGRVVATYDGLDNQPTGEDFFSLGGAPGNNGNISLEVFVDMDRDGDVDLVDFDRDGRLDIVDVDQDGRMDVIDGRANYVDVNNLGSVPVNGGTVNGISGLGVLDYIAVTGVGFNQTAANTTGEAWSNQRELTSLDLLARYNDPLSTESDFVSLVSDFSTSNGGRGGDAYTQTGYSIGDISVSTGDNDLGEADSLVISTTIADAPPGGNPEDVLRAQIGHGAFQVSDTGGTYANYRAGREGLTEDTDVHSAADGGDAGFFAVNGNGGRGGNAVVQQGQIRDLDGALDQTNFEFDHLVGDIFVNTPNYLDGSASTDAGRISISSTTGSIDVFANTQFSLIGHHTFSASYANNSGGTGASSPGGEDGSSQTENANGGDGGEASILQRQVKGEITVMTASDDLDGSGDFSLELTAENTEPSGGANIVISQIGHGRLAVAFGGAGGDGDDAQFRANGGEGGDAVITQESILDTGIIIDLVEANGVLDGYDGNGMLVSAQSLSGSNDVIRAQVGHGDLASAVGGDGGNGTPDFNVLEQRNQTANGGTGGDAVVNQAGYNYDITVEVGSNLTGDDALQILSSAGADTNGTDDHILAAIGHGGIGFAQSGSGGDGGLNGAVTGIPTEDDPNLVDGDYFGVTAQGDTVGAIDTENRITLGTTRRGGDAGDAIVNLAVGGTGEIISGRETNNDYGINDTNGADITISVVDLYESDGMSSTGTFGSDGILIQTTLGPGSNQDAARYITAALVGHHGFVDTIGGAGGQGIQSSLGATISDGDGGDGGSAISTIAAFNGDVSISNMVGMPSTIAGDFNNSTGDQTLDTNITIETINGTPSDGNDHRGESRVGHFTQLEATAGDGGDSAREEGSPPSFPATISTQGGDGGDALTYQGQLEGDIALDAENSVIVSARDTTVGSGALVAAIGHRTVGEAIAGNGAFGGTYSGDSESQSVYFTYEALREFHARRTAGASDEAAYAALSGFEQKLVAPVVDYFENKPGELEVFLDRLVGDDPDVIAANNRDDDFVGNTDYTIGALVDGTGHMDGADDGEIETLSAILAASGHGGNAAVVQGSVSLTGNGGELSANGDISLTANAFNTDDVDRGIIIEGVAGSLGTSFQLAHVGHQAEAHEVVGGFGQDVNGRNATANGIAGDGGDAIVDQYAQNGSIDLVSNHSILVSARDVATSAHETRAFVGHRLTTGSDYTAHRAPVTVVAGNGGDEQSVPFADGHNGNGGDVFIIQRGVISGTNLNGLTFDTEISLAALEESDDDNSITIETLATADSAPDVETHIGHDFLIHAVKAGDGGRQASDSGPEGAAEGLLEGNGGDIFIAQTDLGADIDIVGRDQVLIQADSVLGNHAHLLIGHERTIGNSSETDNPRSGDIIAGFGGDAIPEDVNGTALSSIEAAAAGIIEDADSGRIEISLGLLGDSFENDGSGNDAEERLITIMSITEDLDILSSAATGATSIIEIGNQQQVIANTQSAGELQAVPFVQTAGDAGGIYINRDDIYGDIVLQAIDADRAGSSNPGEGKQVVLDTTSGAGATAILQVGHETEFTATAGTPVTARAAFGEDRNFLFDTNLQAFVDLDPADDTNNAGVIGGMGQATLADAQNAVEDLADLVAALELAAENADRFPADDGVAEAAGASADRGELFALLNDARQALADARTDLANIGNGTGEISEATAVNNVQGHANEAIAAATDFQTMLDAVFPNGEEQIADFAEGGDIIYGDPGLLALDGTNTLNTHTDSISGFGAFDITNLRTINIRDGLGSPTDGMGVPMVVDGFEVADTGVVRGDVSVLSGRDNDLTGIDLTSVADVIGNDTILTNNFGGTGFTGADDLDDSVVIIGATGDADSLTEVGHRRVMTNTTEFGGGDTNAAPEEGGVAGDGGSIVTRNATSGDIDVQAEEVVVFATGAAGTAEVHLLHSSLTENTAGWSDIQTLLGNGGDIVNNNTVSGGVMINAEQMASALDAQDRMILADGLADTLIHLGHQVEDVNESQSDPNEAGNLGDTQDNLGSNRGGSIFSDQTVAGNAAGDLVVITLDAAGDGNASDLVIQTAGLNDSDIRLGNGEDGMGRGILNEGLSGVNNLDDGSTVTLRQDVSGDIEISMVEDLELNAFGLGDQAIYIGHDAEQFGQSGEVNSPPTILQYGERVDVDQSISGNVNITTTSTFTADLALTANELHIGHEGTQSAFSADDSENPSDLEDLNGDGIADNGVGGDEGPSSTGVNDNFDQPDVLANQTIDAGISIVTGEITLNNAGAAGRLHVGHEAFHLAAVDGDLTDNFDGTNQAVTGTSVANGSTGHVVATSVINGNGDDILFQATGVATNNDAIVDPTARTNNGVVSYGANGDIQLVGALGAEIQVGHRSTSTMGDNTPAMAPEGQFNTLQAIGSSVLDADGNEVADTSQSVIIFEAAQDIILTSVTGETQVGHFITEEGNATSTTSPVFVDGDDATGLAEGDSELRQIVGSDIIFGDNTNQGSGGVGTEGAGNNVVIETATGRTMIGHQSPETNEWQVEGSRSVTVQLLDGDITVEAGTDAGADAPDGTVLADAAAALADETGLGDDLLILSGGGVARIGHNIAGGDEGVNNETQRGAGDISVRSGGDMHILGGAIGHENYDIASIAPSTLNATPESLGSATPIRDRLRGNTTIGAGQNSAPEDSTLIADILLIDGSANPVVINSGYGGQGNADVDGELRFFLPAQEGLTITPAVTFNDSDSNGDAVPARVSNPENVFENEGGLDHEHPFEFFSETAAYNDSIIGPGNFGFYFEAQPANADIMDVFTPFYVETGLGGEFRVVYTDRSPGQRSVVNIDALGDDYIGTGSMDLMCEVQMQQAGLTDDESFDKDVCDELAEVFEGFQQGIGSHVSFSATAGGNQNDDNRLRFYNEPGDVEVYGFAPVSIETELTGRQVSVFGARPLVVVDNAEPVSFENVEVPDVAAYVYRPIHDTAAKFADPDINQQYGEYVATGTIEAQIQQEYPDALSIASSYQIYQEKL